MWRVGRILLRGRRRGWRVRSDRDREAMENLGFECLFGFEMGVGLIS